VLINIAFCDGFLKDIVYKKIDVIEKELKIENSINFLNILNVRGIRWNDSRYFFKN